MVADQNRAGYESSSQDYFYNLNGSAEDAPKRSSICEARSKLSYKAFEYLFKSLNLDQSSLVSNSQTWKEHVVRAVDGTKITLPATEKILKEYPRRLNKNASFEHYSFSIVTTAVNVITGQPNVVRMGDKNSSEREHLYSMLEEFEKGDIILLDRGFDGVNVWTAIEDQDQFFVGRIKTKGKGFSKLTTSFLKSSSQDKIITLTKKSSIGENPQTIKIRLIRGRKLKTGNCLVVATNLLDKKKYSAKEVLDLYSKRWKVESHYGRSKTLLQLSKFHGKDCNKIKQELFANLLMISITSLVMMDAEREKTQPIQSSKKIKSKKVTQTQASFKNAIHVVKRNFLYILGSPKISVKGSRLIAEKILKEIAAIRCSIQPGRSYPRYSRQAVNRWAYAKQNKINQFNTTGRIAS